MEDVIKLIRQGLYLVESIEDIRELLGQQSSAEDVKVEAEIDESIKEKEGQIKLALQYVRQIALDIEADYLPHK